MEKLYSCAEISERYGVKIGTVWKWIREKKLKAIRIGKQYSVPESELVRIEREQARKGE